MARENVEKIQCDRCNRIELRPIPATPLNGAPRPPDLDVSFSGQRLIYADLCGKCLEAVGNLFTAMKEYQREIKYTILKNVDSARGPAVDENAAPPLQPAPNYSPPQPHSASAKR